jgi:glutamate-1-semialdehyde 2,1-aminomutase
VRAFGAVGGTPPFITRGAGAYLWDAEGSRLLDYISSWGAIILGHAEADVVEAVQAAATNGTSFGTPNPREIALAELIRSAMPSVESLRFTSSGTEETMSAIRLARAYTGREKVMKFAGCYHGHADMLLTQSGSGVATLGLPGSAGVPAAATKDTLVAPYNDANAVADLFRECPDQIAAVIVEPVAANMGLVLPERDFLSALRSLTAEHGALLIFDEVITGFRVAQGGAQGRYGIVPDLTCLGKIIGGGLPVGAYGGARKIMERVAPLGPMYQAGTLSGNPLAMAAGAAVLRRLAEPDVYSLLEAHTIRLAEGLRAILARTASVTNLGSMLTVFFRPSSPKNYIAAQESDTRSFARFFHAMLRQRILLPPSQFEAWFLTASHSDDQIEATLAAAREALP